MVEDSLRKSLIYGEIDYQQRSDATVCPAVKIHDLLDGVGKGFE